MASFSPGVGRRPDAPPSADPPLAPAPGAVLFGRYRLDERIGVGGMAEVWRAHDEQLDRDVAVKLLHRHLLPDERSRARFAAEARTVAGLSHPGIVTVYDIVVDDDQAAMVMELVDGEPLSAVIARNGRLPEMAAASITAQVAHALQAAHDRGLVHRDVKPANVLVAADGHARLVDFGIARALDDRDPSLNMPGTIMGTLRYMAPEQLADGGADRATDVFGLGSLLYEMLVGRPPFPAATPAALMAQQRQGAPQIHATSPELAGLARTALQADAERRPRSTGRMAVMLERWLSNRGVSPADLPAVAAAAMDGRPLPKPSPPGVTSGLTDVPTRAPAPADQVAGAIAADGLAAADGQMELREAPAAATDGWVFVPPLPPPAAIAAVDASSEAVTEAHSTEPSGRPPLAYRPVPLVAALGLAGLLLAGLLIAGSLAVLQAGQSRPTASPAASHAAPTVAPLRAAPTVKPAATAAPIIDIGPRPPRDDKPGKGPGKGKPPKD